MADEKDDKISDGILGITGSPVPKEPGDPTTAHDPESVEKRKARMREGALEPATQEDPDRQRSGATGIDMGSGGQGTDLSGD